MSGYLEKGQWHGGRCNTRATDGKFVRSTSAFRDWVTAGGSGDYPSRTVPAGPELESCAPVDRADCRAH